MHWSEASDCGFVDAIRELAQTATPAGAGANELEDYTPEVRAAVNSPLHKTLKGGLQADLEIASRSVRAGAVEAVVSVRQVLSDQDDTDGR